MRVTMSGGTLAGRNRPSHGSSAYPGTPASAMVGVPGRLAKRCGAVLPRSLSLPSLICGRSVWAVRLVAAAPRLESAWQQVRHRRCCALVWNVVHLRSGQALEHHRAEVLRAAVAGGAVVQLARVRLGIVDQFLN